MHDCLQQDLIEDIYCQMVKQSIQVMLKKSLMIHISMNISQVLKEISFLSSQTPAYNSRFIYILMFLVAFFWGLAWPVGRILATDLLSYPYSVMFFRYLFAIPVLFGWLWFKEGNVVPLKRDYSYLLMLCLLYTSPSPRDKRQSRMPSSA